MSNSSSGLGDTELHDLITIEVSRVILEDLPLIFGTIKYELVVMVDEQFWTA